MSEAPGGREALFKVEGGSSIGMGHVMRSLELAEELEFRCVGVTGFLCNNDRHVEEKITSRGFRAFILPNERSLQHELLEFLAQKRPHILVFDHPGDFEPLCRTLKSSCPHLFMVALDHFVMDNEYVDVIINLFNHHPTLKVPTSHRVRYYEGVKYSIIRKGFDGYHNFRKSIPARAKDVMVSFGGSDPMSNTLRVMEALKTDFPKDITFHFVLGTSFIQKERIKEFSQQLERRSEFYENLNSIEEIMYRCDLGLVGGGTTMLEMACLGVPAIIIAQSANEARFADYLAELGVVISLGVGEEVKAEAIFKALVGLAKDHSARERMSMAGKELIDGRGRERIAERIVQDYDCFRGAHG